MDNRDALLDLEPVHKTAREPAPTLPAGFVAAIAPPCFAPGIRVREVLQGGSGPLLCVRRGPLPIWVGWHRRRRRRAVLDLARATADLSGLSCRAPRLCVASAFLRPTATRCRSVSRRRPLAFRASASTARCATPPACERARARADDRCGRRLAPGAAAVPAIPARVRLGPALHADIILAEIAKNHRSRRSIGSSTAS